MWLVHMTSLKNAVRSMHLLNITSPQIIQSVFSLQKTPVKHLAWKRLIFCQPRRPQGTWNYWLRGHKQKHRNFCLCTWEEKKKKTLQKQSTTTETCPLKSLESTPYDLISNYWLRYHICRNTTVLGASRKVSKNLIKYRRHHSDAHGSSLHSSHLRWVVSSGSYCRKSSLAALVFDYKLRALHYT